MQAGEGEEESGTGGQTSGLSAVQGLPWWGGGGQQSVQSAPSGPVKSLFVEHPTGATAGVGPLGFTHSHALQHAPAPVLIQSDGQGSSARMHPLQTSVGGPAHKDEVFSAVFVQVTRRVELMSNSNMLLLYLFLLNRQLNTLYHAHNWSWAILWCVLSILTQIHILEA